MGASDTQCTVHASNRGDEEPTHKDLIMQTDQSVELDEEIRSYHYAHGSTVSQVERLLDEAEQVHFLPSLPIASIIQRKLSFMRNQHARGFLHCAA